MRAKRIRKQGTNNYLKKILLQCFSLLMNGLFIDLSTYLHFIKDACDKFFKHELCDLKKR